MYGLGALRSQDHLWPHMEGEQEVVEQTAASRQRQRATHIVAKTSSMVAAMIESYELAQHATPQLTGAHCTNAALVGNLHARLGDG